MSATACTCIHDAMLVRVVPDPGCPATLLHQVFHGAAVGSDADS